ncbi:hypothetical protein [Sutcliffiella sp. NC1]|uniref:hypothetical protein n=1 Tax=Sutcliffiella sp. NC1 TaxID=3004096 RepID=UPI0022DE01D8|nr:hypothetical protein [Sutcliffiella sp. NC1]WBL13155.1 hypothetical protein O1A01_14560 [Sutcliffiella sp. NC1]
MMENLKLCFLAFSLFLLVGCNSDIVVSPNITVEGETISTIGYSGTSADTESDKPPEIYEMLDITVVKPKAEISISYKDTPKKVLVKSWYGAKLVEDDRELKEYKITVPSEEGIYIYSLAARWNFRTASNSVFVIEVKR